MSKLKYRFIGAMHYLSLCMLVACVTCTLGKRVYFYFRMSSLPVWYWIQNCSIHKIYITSKLYLWNNANEPKYVQLLFAFSNKLSTIILLQIYTTGTNLYNCKFVLGQEQTCPTGTVMYPTSWSHRLIPVQYVTRSLTTIMYLTRW